MSSTVKESTAITITLSKEFCEQFSCEEESIQKQILGALNKLRYSEHNNGLKLEPFEGNQQLFSCRYNQKERLILQRHHDGWYVQQLMDDHKYIKVQTKDIIPHQTFSDFLPEVSLSADCSHVEVSPAFEHHFFGEFSLTLEQQEVCQARFPIILSGGAGSGKSLILCQRAEELLDVFVEDEKVLLLTVPRLVSDVSKEWKSRPAYNSRLEICCYADLFGSHVEQEKIEEWLSCDDQKGIPAHVRPRIKPQFGIISTCIDQTEYFKREEISEAEKQNFWTLFERYKHSPQYKHSVAHDKIEEWLSGDGRTYIPPSIKSNAIIKQEFDIISACDNQQEYLELGARQSYVELQEEKKSLWELFKRYQSSRQYKVDLRYQLFDLAKKFSAVLVDESQMYSHAQLRNIRKLCSGSNFIWAFDNSQNAFGSYSPESFIRSMCRHENFFDLELSSSFRCPKQILDIANQVKEVQHFLVGNQSKQSSSEQSKVSELHLGTVSYMKPDDGFQVKNNLHFAVCTPQKFLEEAKRKFPNSLVLLPGEAPGLEFETVLLWRVLEDDAFAKVEKIYRNKQEPTKNRSPVRLDNIEISPLLSNLYVAITRAKSNLVICTQESHNQKIRRLWAAFGLKDPSIASSKLTQQSELAKENIAPNAQETKARIAELRRKGISEEQILRISGHQSQQKNEPVCAGGGGKARTLKVYKLPQSSGPQPLLELCETAYQKEHVESIAKVPEDVKKLINLCFGLEKQNLTRFLKKMLEKCTSARVLEEALKLNIDGSTMESFIKADEDRCQSFMMAIHQLDEKSFSENHKYKVLKSWFKQNDVQLNQLIGLICSDFEFYNGKLSKLITKNAPPSKQNLWEAFQRIKTKLSDYRSKLGVFPPEFQTPLCLAIGVADSELPLALIKIGADLEREVDHIRCTPLIIAIGLNRNRELELLLENKADVDKVCTLGYTPLIRAIECKNMRALELLLENKADVDKVCTFGDTPLIRAIKSDNIRALELLLEKKADVDKVCTSGNTPLIYAIESNNMRALELLLEKKADVDKVCTSGYTPLVYAIEFKNNHALELLLEKKADVDKVCTSGYTPLIHAIESDNIRALELLLEKKADVDKVCTSGYTPLIHAIESDNIRALELLLENKADFNKVCTLGYTPLIRAIECNNMRALELLLEKKADVDKVCTFGDTPLIRAIKSDNIRALELLLEKKADVDKGCASGNTPLIYAIAFNNISALEILLKTGVNIDKGNNDGVTPIMRAIRCKNLQALQLLKVAGANVHQSVSNGYNALDFAMSLDYQDGIKLLLDAKADPNQLCDNETLIKLAIVNNNTTALELLLKAGANPDLLSKNGTSSLMAAIQQNQLINVDLLLQANADPNLSSNGVTPLMLAIERNQVESLELLLKAGAKFDQTDDSGDSPLMHAVKCNHPETVKLLIEYGADVNQENSKGITPLDMANDLNNNAALMLLMHTTSRTPHF